MNYRRKSIPYLGPSTHIFKKACKDNCAPWSEGFNFKQVRHKVPNYGLFRNRKAVTDENGDVLYEFTALNHGFLYGREMLYLRRHGFTSDPRER